jgi:hypothetical protein
LFPTGPGELVLGGVDQHEPENWTEGAPGAQALIGEACICDFYRCRFDDLLALAVEDGGAGDAHCVQRIAFVEGGIAHGAGEIFKVGDGAGGIEARQLGNGVADIGRGETHDAALLGEIGSRGGGNVGGGRSQEGRSIGESQECALGTRTGQRGAPVCDASGREALGELKSRELLGEIGIG